MRLSDDTVMFTFHGIPILGSKTSGNIIGLSGEGLEICERMKTRDVPRDEVAAVDARLADALESAGFLDDGADQPASYFKASYVHVTQRCNLSCVGCYSYGEQRNHLHDATREDFKVVFQKLASIGVSEIVISGGEPFLRADLPDLCSDAKQAGIRQITVITNGLRVTPDALSALAPFVDCVSVSFDGLSSDSPAYIRGEQRFDDLVAAIGMIREAGIRAHMIPTIHRKNYQDVGAYLRLSEELGASLNFSLLSCCDPNEEAFSGLVFDDDSLGQLGRTVYEMGKRSSVDVVDLPVSLNLSIRHGCGAARTTLSVDADGSVYPCHMLHYRELKMGNAFDDPIDAIIACDIAERLSSLDEAVIEGCAGCECGPFCGGGCRARAYAESRSLSALDPFCAMTSEFYRCVGSDLAAAYA